MPLKFNFLVIVLMGVLLSSTATGDIIESLMMPGKLIEGHKKYENDCNNCHEKFSKKKQSRLCRECHKRIDKEIKGHKGHHGRIHGISTNECKTCHTDHKGREMDIIKLDQQAFDHTMTDFPLKGRHQLIACDSCHRAEKPYHKTPVDCYSCHKKDDSHKGNLGKKCKQCHTSSNWHKAKFDHDKTDFKLTGQHKKTACINCHINQRYKDSPKACHQCHINKDIHQGSFGQKCDNCHQSDKWITIKFNHDKETDFKLSGKHRKIRCESCHSKDPYKNKTPQQCYSCHKKDDIHKGVFGKKCQQCHSETSWAAKQFNHDRDTDFPLRNAHKRARCSQCHDESHSKQATTRSCYSCHRADDIHNGSQGKKCGDCHNDKDWSSKVAFDHDLSNFPLIGLHATVTCEDCHSDANYRDTPTQCIKCHKKDDIHKNSFGKECEDCHNPNAWNRWVFDHNKETDYKLEQAHENLECHACHVVGKPAKGTSTSCYQCHANDDAHNGSFGRRCEQCHRQDTFTNIHMTR